MKIFLNEYMITFLDWSFFLISSFLLVFYISFVNWILKIWNSSSSDLSDTNTGINKFISVVIVGRNEAGNLKKCIDSILSNNYPNELFEVIYIDDHSEDGSVNELCSIESANFRFYELKDHISGNNKNSYKKIAIDLGISKTVGEIIILTDADTIAGKEWIRSHTDQYNENKNLKLSTGPVIYKYNYGFLEKFQYYDLIATMGFTNSGIAEKKYFMANGANMSFVKEIYEIETLRHDYASGDDIFLIQETAKKFPDSVKFIKSAKVAIITNPEHSIRAFISQRLRWGSKSMGYKDQKLKTILGLLFFVNLFIIIDVIWFVTAANTLSAIVLIVIILKIISDILLIRSVGLKLGQKIEYIMLIVSLLIYPLYLVTIGLLSLSTSKYYWKGRKVK